MHHVERCDAAATGDAITVQHIARLTRNKLWKGFGQGRRVLPVNGEVTTVQQAGSGKKIGAAGNAADPDALARKTPQGRMEACRLLPVFRIATGDDEDRVIVAAGPGYVPAGDGEARGG